MKIPSNYLQAFYAVSQTLHFAKAQSILHITQSAISQRILALEEMLETTLFIRERSNLRLTVDGEKLLRYCQQQEQSEAEILGILGKKSQSALSGTIRVGGFSSIMKSALMPSLAPLFEKNSTLGLQLITKELNELLPLLRRAEVDFIITNENPEKEDIEAHYLGTEENILVVSGKHQHILHYLDHDPEHVTTQMYFKIKKEPLKNVSIRYVDNVEGLIEGARLGLGKAVVPRHLINPRDGLKILNPKTTMKVPMYLLFYRQNYYSKLHHEIINHIKNYFKIHFPH
jgi:DNA-binding transcriptional LysR family regulator